MADIDRSGHWDGVYGSKQDQEVSWYQAHPAISLELIGAAGLSENASVLDVGSGVSRLIDALLERGYKDVSVLDVSSTAIRRAQARLGERSAQVNWIVADVTSWTPGRTYDIWHDRAVFHFLHEPEDREAYRDTAARALRPGGQLIIGTFALDGPERCSGLPVIRYDAEGLAKQFGDGFRLKESRLQDHVTPAGKMQRFQFARLQRV